jgi:hypothetical protein
LTRVIDAQSARFLFTRAIAIAVVAFMDLRSRARQTLLDYLDADLTLAMTFVDVARGHYRRGNSPVGDRCKSHAEVALRTVRHFIATTNFIAKVDRYSLTQGCDRLEREIATLAH